jgi:hypothetical protein
MSPASAVQIQSASAAASLILNSTLVSRDTQEKFDHTLKSVQAKLDQFKSSCAPKTLKEFEAKVKDLNELFAAAKAHVHSKVAASDGDRVAPQLLRAAEKTAFYTLQESFNASKKQLGATLVAAEMSEIGKNLAKLNPTGELQEFLQGSTACVTRTAELGRVIERIGLNETHSIESLKTQLQAKFAAQLDSLGVAEMDVTEIAMTADQVHGLFCENQDLMKMTTLEGGSGPIVLKDCFKDVMTEKFNHKAEEMLSEITEKLKPDELGYDPQGASRLLLELQAAVDQASDSKHDVSSEATAGKKSGPVHDLTFNDIGAAREALKQATVAVAVDRLLTTMARETDYLSDPDYIHDSVVANPKEAAANLRSRIFELDTLEREAGSSPVSSRPGTPGSAGSMSDVSDWSARNGSKSLDEIRHELTGILDLAERMATVETVLTQASSIGSRYTSVGVQVTLKEVNEAIGTLRAQADAAQESRARSSSFASTGSFGSGLSVTTAESLLEGSIDERVGSGSVGAGYLNRLRELKADLEAAGDLDHQVAELKGQGTMLPKEGLAMVCRQLAEREASPPSDSRSVGTREVASRRNLEDAQSTAVQSALKFIESTFSVNEKDFRVGVELTPGLLDSVKTGMALLTQLSSQEAGISKLNGLDGISTKLQTIERARDRMMAAIQTKAGHVVGTSQSTDGQRLEQLTQASHFCSEIGISHGTIDDAIQATVEKVKGTLDEPLQGISTAANGTPEELRKAIVKLGVAVKRAAESLKADPRSRNAMLEDCKKHLEAPLEGAELNLNVTGGNHETLISDSVQLMMSIAAIGRTLGAQDWPTEVMFTKVADKLKPVVDAAFKAHTLGIVVRTTTLQALDDHQQEVLRMARVFGNGTGLPPQISRFMEAVGGVPAQSGSVEAPAADIPQMTATKAITLAKLQVAMRDVTVASEAVALDPNTPVDLDLMTRCAAVLNGPIDPGHLPTAANVEGLTRDVGVSRSLLPNLTGVDVATSQTLRELGGKFQSAPSEVAARLASLSIPMDQDRTKTNAAMVIFLEKLNRTPPSNVDDQISIRTALLRSDLVTDVQKIDVVTHLATLLSTQWEERLLRIGHVVDTGSILGDQLEGIQQLGLSPAHTQTLTNSAWQGVVDNILPKATSLYLEHSVTMANAFEAALGKYPPQNGAQEIVAFIRSVRLGQSAKLAGEFTGQLSSKPQSSASAGSMWSRGAASVPVETPMQRSLRIANSLEQTLGKLTNKSMEGEANSLTSTVAYRCAGELGEIYVANAPGRAIELLYSVHCMMGKFPSDTTQHLPVVAIRAELKNKIDTVFAGFAGGVPKGMTVEHLRMFRVISDGIDLSAAAQGNTHAAEQNVVKSWGDTLKPKADAAYQKMFASQGMSTASAMDSFNVGLTVATRLERSGANSVVSEWDAVHALMSGRHSTDIVADLMPTIGGLKAKQSGVKDVSQISAAMTLSAKASATITKEDVQQIVKALAEDQARVGPSEGPLIPKAELDKMEAAITGFLTGLGSVRVPLMSTHAIAVTDSSIRAARNECLALTALVRDCAAVVGSVPDGGVAIDGAFIGIDNALTQLNTEISQLPANALLRSATGTQVDTRDVKIAAVGAHIRNEAREIAESESGLLADNAQAILSARGRLVSVFNLANAARCDTKSFVTEARAVLEPRVEAYFGRIAIDNGAINCAGTTQLDEVGVALNALDSLPSTSVLSNVRDTEKAPKLVELAAARVLNAMHNIRRADGDGMKNLATVLRGDLTGVDLTQSVDAMYGVATGIENNTDGEALTLKMANAALIDAPDEHKLAVMAQVLNASKGAVVDELSVDALGTKLTLYVASGVELAQMTGPQMATALANINTFLTTVGDGAAVQKLPDAVKGKISELVQGALLAAERGGSITANDGAWEGCRPQIETLKVNLGITAAQQFGDLTDARVAQFSESILTVDQRTTRDEIVGLDHVRQAPDNAQDISTKITVLLGRLNTQDNFTVAQKADLKRVIAEALPKLQIDPNHDLQVQADTIGAALTALNSAAADVQPENMAQLTTDIVGKFEAAQLDRIRGVTFSPDDISSQDGALLADKKQVVEGFGLADVGGVLVLKDLGAAERTQKLDDINKAQVLNILHFSGQLSESPTATQEHVAAAPALLDRLSAATEGRAVVTETVATIRAGLGLEAGTSILPLQEYVTYAHEILGGLVALRETLGNIGGGVENATVIPPAQRSASLVRGALRNIANLALADEIDSPKLATLAHLLRSTEGRAIKLGDEGSATYLDYLKFEGKLTEFIGL